MWVRAQQVEGMVDGGGTTFADWLRCYGELLSAHVGNAADGLAARASEFGCRLRAAGVTLEEIVAAHLAYLRDAEPREGDADERVLRATTAVLRAVLSAYGLRPCPALPDNVIECLDMNRALQRERDLVSAVLDTVGALVVVLDPEGRIVRFNRACEQVTGYTFEEVSGRPFWEILLPREEIASVSKTFEALRAGQFPNQRENHWVTKAGQRRLIAWSNTALVEGDGRVEYVIGTGLDITERRRAEQTLRQAHSDLELRVAQRTADLRMTNERLEQEIADRTRIERALRESEARLRNILEAAPIPMVISRLPDGVILYGNFRLGATFGIPSATLLGRRTQEFYHDPAERAALLQTFQTQGRLRDYELRVKKADGTPFWVVVSAERITFDRQDALLAGFYDVTDRKRAEEALRESELRYRRLVETASVVPWEADARTGRFTYVGPQALALLGFPVEAWCGELFWEQRLHPEDREWVVRYCLESCGTRDDYECEYRMIAADGRTIWVRDFVSVVRENGTPRALRGFLFDITKHKQAELEARQRQEELTHVLRLSTLGEMAAGLAHELNQPLSAISNYARGCARRIRAGAVAPEALLDAAEQIADQAEKAGEIIRGMRALVRKRTPQRENVAINAVVREVAGIAEVEARQHGVTLRLQLEEPLEPVLADMIQLEQVILNLARNGFEAMSEPGAEVRELLISTRAAESNRIEVAVRDTGPGLSLQEAQRIFEPFFTTKPGGLGMGLSISRTIIESHGGRLWASANTDRGATFCFSIPIIGGGPRGEC